MVRHALLWMVGGLMVLGLSGWCLAGEGDAPQPEPKKEEVAKKEEPARKEVAGKQVDEFRSVIGKLIMARRKFVQSDPTLLEKLKKIQEKQAQVRKEELDFNAELRTKSPEIDALEKQREEIEAARKAQHKAARPPRK